MSGASRLSVFGVETDRASDAGAGECSSSPVGHQLDSLNPGFASARTDNNQAAFVPSLACRNVDGMLLFPIITDLFPGEEGVVTIKCTGNEALSMTVESPNYVTHPMASGSSEVSPDNFGHQGSL